MNKVILLGRLARDPDIRYSQGNEPMCVARFTVAVTKRFKRDNEPDADFISCVAFGKQGEFVERYLKKSMQISLCGRIQVREYTDNNTGQRRWSTDVVAEEINFAESRTAFEARRGQEGGGDYGGGQPSSQSAPPMPSYEPPEGFSAITQSIDDDDLPF